MARTSTRMTDQGGRGSLGAANIYSGEPWSSSIGGVTKAGLLSTSE